MEVIHMKDRGLKTRTPLSNAVDSELLKELKSYSAETGIPISKLLDKSIKLFLETVKK
jgi:hypothetical protein